MSVVGRVFVVDDDPSLLRGLERLFRSAGLAVEAFESPVAFLENLSHDMPSCLVIDLMLPALTGLDVQQQLARMGEDLPIVFISGRGDVASAACAMRHGAVDFLVKPPDERQLLYAVARALTRDRMARSHRRIEQSVRDGLALLTARELQVCYLVSEGLLNKQIAAQLGASEKTIKVHRGRVMRKLNVQSVAALVRLLAHVPELDARS